MATTVIGKLIELFIGFGTSFAEQNVEIFEGRRVDGTEAVGAIDITCGSFLFVQKCNAYRLILIPVSTP